MRLKLGLLVCLLPFIANMASADDQTLSAVVKSINDFSLDLYLATVENKGPGKNVLVSPISAAIVTAMLHPGAKGKTAEEIERHLYLPSDKNTRESGFKSLHDLLSNTPNVTLDVANSIFVEKSKQLNQNYQQHVKDIHKSEIQPADFINNAEKERGTINNWVSEKTHQKIKELLRPGVLTSDTRMVLVNAVYFYGKWKEQFDKAQTHDEDFYVTKDKPVKVPMMHMTKTLRYAEIPELEAKAVELCYANEQVCMQIILPNAKDGLASLHEKLRSKTFDLSNINFNSNKVHLTMPKFKIEETMNIKEIYQKMGITTMFSNDADLSGLINDPEPLKVSEAVQKTFMDVNEEGTEAAAATEFAVQLGSSLVLMPTSNFVVDHPFVLRMAVETGTENATRASLFVGQLVNPKPQPSQ